MDLNDPAQQIAFENLLATAQGLVALRDRLILEGYEDEFSPHRFVVYRGAHTAAYRSYHIWYVARQSSPRQAIISALTWAKAQELATRLAYDRQLWATVKNRPTVYRPAYREVI